jgi:hypothetical protein
MLLEDKNAVIYGGEGQSAVRCRAFAQEGGNLPVPKQNFIA